MSIREKPFKGFVRVFTMKNGKQKRFHSLSFLAESLHRTPGAIVRWQRLGITPGPVVRMTDGNRWYTEEEITLYITLVERYELKQGTPIPKEFVAELKSGLAKIKAKLSEEGYV